MTIKTKTQQKEITLAEYQELVKRTANPLEHSKALQNWSLGLVGESGEFAAKYNFITDSEEGLMGEAGDIAYYAAMMANQCGISLEDVPTPSHFVAFDGSRLMLELWVNSSHIAELVKKHLYHNKPLPVRTVGINLASIILCLDMIGKRNGFTLQQVMRHNNDKLTARHPNGFQVNPVHPPF